MQVLILSLLIALAPATAPTTKPSPRTIHSLRELTDEMPEALLKNSGDDISKWITAQFPIQYEGELLFARSKIAKDWDGNDVIECLAAAQGYKSRGTVISKISVTVQVPLSDRDKLAKLRPGKFDKFVIRGEVKKIKFTDHVQSDLSMNRDASIVIYNATVVSK